MRAGAVGVGLQRPEFFETRHHVIRQRCQRLGVAAETIVVTGAKLSHPFSQPDPAVGTLEAAAVRLGKIGQFLRYLLGRKAAGKQRAGRFRLRKLGKAVGNAREQPIAMYARVPVVAAEKNRMQGAQSVDVPFVL